ncbi:bZIP transcription factor [Diplocarpon rosae]|nr:bZIP transcription factor [Diplocarpon rosae]
MDQPSEEELDMNKDEYHANGKKMTDDEKRKNFLERNRQAFMLRCFEIQANFEIRIAALKCRQRKKQWLANLQQKVEMYALENDNLNHCIEGLKEELLNLKTLLTAHKDCPVSHSQGLSNGGIQQLVEGGFANSHMHPYGIGSMNNPQQQQQQQQQMMANQAYHQRREP